MVAQFSGSATLLDVRRDAEYDANQAVQRYLQQSEVKVGGCAHGHCARVFDCVSCACTPVLAGPFQAHATLQAALGVPEDVEFVSCSDEVAVAMGPDVMRSVLHLVPDVVEAMPVLLYQGLHAA